MTDIEEQVPAEVPQEEPGFSVEETLADMQIQLKQLAEELVKMKKAMAVIPKGADEPPAEPTAEEIFDDEYLRSD